MFRQSLFAGVTISLIAYEIGLFLKRKLGLAILNPLLVSIVIVILALKVFGISYEVYNASAKYISYFYFFYLLFQSLQIYGIQVSN